jgi:transposase
LGYREVGVLEIKEVLRLWLAGNGKKRIARQLGIDPKTVRRYVRGAEEACNFGPASGPESLTDEMLAAVIAGLGGPKGREHGNTWARCEEHRQAIEQLVRRSPRLRLTKVHRLLAGKGIEIPYATLRRFAVAELGFGRCAPTIAVLDGDPGDELQLDVGRMGMFGSDLAIRRRHFKAWIFTAVRSRHRFVYPDFKETTESAIEACEAAWAFFGGIFRTLLPDNTSAIVHTADPLYPRIVHGFLEYAQTRGFQIDPARVRHPKDKARVERTVPHVRDDCFAGESLLDLDHARVVARRWCLEQYGMRRHTRTQRLPLEHFEAEEKPVLLPGPTQPYDIPLWADPKVARDQYAQVAYALYSLPERFRGKKLRARADRQTVRFYDNAVLVKTHPRQPKGGRSTDPNDFPLHKRAYAHRDIAFLIRQAEIHGPSVGRLATILLDDPLPWTRMRRVYALLGLARKYGAHRTDEACAAALAVEMHDIRRLQRMLEAARSVPADSSSTSRGTLIQIARYLRPKEQYALSFRQPEVPDDSRNDLT